MRTDRFGQVAVLFLLVAMLLPAAAAQNQDPYSPCDGETLSDDLACAMLPANTTLTPQKMVFGVLLPFLLTFAIIYFGMKSTPIGARESFVVALATSLFIIPSGVSLAMGEIFLSLLQGIASGFGIEVGVSGGGDAVTPTEAWAWMNERGGAIAVLTGIVFSIFFGLTDREISISEYLLIPLIVVGVWFVLGGAEVLFQIIVWVVLFGVGMTLLKEPLRHDTGVMGKILALIGIIVVGWTLSSFGQSGLLAEVEVGPGQTLADTVGVTLQNFGQIILDLVASALMVFIIIIAAIGFILLKFGAAVGGGGDS